MTDECAVQVAVRVRDLLPQERLSGYVSCIEVQRDRVVVGGKRGFGFDIAFAPTCSQASVYETAVKPLMQTCSQGINVTVVAYGQTGSGKTYTMGTAGLAFQSEEQQGIAPRLAADIFAQADSGGPVSVAVSCLEIYGEELHDLLAHKSNSKLQIREHPGGQIAVTGLREVEVSNQEHLLDVLGTGLLKRATGSTHMNEESSRSHAICTITINGCGSRTSPSGSTTPRNYTSKIQLVDLAGSERLSQTFSRTTKETCQINKGLHALSNVIMALSPMPATAAAAQHVPYRDSKLTRVLQDALGGSARTVLIACVSAADESVNETLSTLQYAARARRIQNRPVDLATSNAAEAVQLSAVQRMQWTLLRRHLAAVGLMPLPEILMQDVHTMTDADARQHLLQAANALVPASAGPPASLKPSTAPAGAPEYGSANCMDGPLDGTPLPQHTRGTTPYPPGAQGVGASTHRNAISGLDVLLALDTAPAPLSAEAAGRSSGGDVAARYLPGAEGGAGDAASATGEAWALGSGMCPCDMSGRAQALGQGIFAGPLRWSLPSAGSGGQGEERNEREASGHGAPGQESSAREEAIELSVVDRDEMGPDVVVFDEDAASYVSATDYRTMLHSIAPELGEEADALHSSHLRLQAEREGTDTAHCGAVARLRAQIDDLEATMATQEGELSVLRCEEGRARHDCAVLQHTCADLHTQIVEKQSQLERAHCSLKELEQSLGRSEAERAAARADGEARVAALDARKAELEKQLRGASVAAAAARAQGVAARVHALEARLHVTRTAKASAEQRLQECRAAHQVEKHKLQRDMAGLQRRLRETEKRAVELLREQSRHQEVLARKDRQIHDSQQALHTLQTAVAASPRRQEMSKQTLQWWERQIALLAERACAGGRVTELEQQSAALQQQLDALQGEPPVGSEGTVEARQEERERLTLQQHVTASSLAVGREQLASAAMIKATLQTAAARLVLPQARHLLLHLVTALLAALAREQDSHVQLHTLRSSLSLVTQLNHHLQRPVDEAPAVVSPESATRPHVDAAEQARPAAATGPDGAEAATGTVANSANAAAGGHGGPARGRSPATPSRSGCVGPRSRTPVPAARLLSPTQRGATQRGTPRHAECVGGNGSGPDQNGGHGGRRVGSGAATSGVAPGGTAAAGSAGSPWQASRLVASGSTAAPVHGSLTDSSPVRTPPPPPGRVLRSAGPGRSSRPGSARREAGQNSERRAGSSCAHALILQASIDAGAVRDGSRCPPVGCGAAAPRVDPVAGADGGSETVARASRSTAVVTPHLRSPRSSCSGESSGMPGTACHAGSAPMAVAAPGSVDPATAPAGEGRHESEALLAAADDGLCMRDAPGGSGGWGPPPEALPGARAGAAPVARPRLVAAWRPVEHPGAARGRGMSAPQGRTRLDFDGGALGLLGTGSAVLSVSHEDPERRSCDDLASAQPERWNACPQTGAAPDGGRLSTRAREERQCQDVAVDCVTSGVGRGGIGRWRGGPDRHSLAGTGEVTCDSASSMSVPRRPQSGRKRVHFAEADGVSSFPVEGLQHQHWR